MANVIGSGNARFLTDETGDSIDSDNRLPVETEQDDAFGTFVSYNDFECPITSTALHTALGIVNVTDAKEILIQSDDANTSYIMIGSGAGITLAGNVGSRCGIKLNGGETLVLALSNFSEIYVDALDAGDGTSDQFINVAYFK